MAIKPELIERLREKRERIKNNVPSSKLEALHAKGALSARERIDCLFDEGTFQEMGMHAEHHAVHFGMAGRELPADGVNTVLQVGHQPGADHAALVNDDNRVLCKHDVAMVKPGKRLVDRC